MYSINSIGRFLADKFVVYFNTKSIYNVNLCDIPVIQRGTNGDFIPVGSGKYQIIRDNASVYLEKNPYSFLDTGDNFDISTIRVHDIQSDEELLYNFNYNKHKEATLWNYSLTVSRRCRF